MKSNQKSKGAAMAKQSAERAVLGTRIVHVRLALPEKKVR